MSIIESKEAIYFVILEKAPEKESKHFTFNWFTSFLHGAYHKTECSSIRTASSRTNANRYS